MGWAPPRRASWPAAVDAVQCDASFLAEVLRWLADPWRAQGIVRIVIWAARGPRCRNRAARAGIVRREDARTSRGQSNQEGYWRP